MHIRPYEIKLFAIIALLHYGFFFIPLKHLVSINASKCIYIFDQNKLLILEMFILCLFIIVIFFLSFLLQMLQYVVCQNSFSM